VVPLQCIGIDGQVQYDGRDADDIQEHGNGAENAFESQGREKEKTEHIEKQHEQESECLALVFEVQGKSRDDKGNQKDQGFLQMELPVDILLHEDFCIKKNGVLDQKQLVAAFAQSMGLFNRQFFNDPGAFAAKCALPQSRGKSFQQSDINRHDQDGQQHRKFNKFDRNDFQKIPDMKILPGKFQQSIP
jgi:hypothetical protein